MIEIAVRINQLISSNVNAAVDSATNPVKMLKLMIVEIEEAIIALSRDAGQRERLSRELGNQSERDESAARDWQDKARFAMGKGREDLARGALVERDNARDAASRARTAQAEAQADEARLRETIAGLEQRLSDARTRLTKETSVEANACAASPTTRSASAGEPSRSERVMERIDTLEKRIDFASAATAPTARAASLDEELAELARDERIDAELAALRQAGGGKSKKK
ncbi:MAG: PspA/IM30 family protein [Proteobacteria bacterium]|nr:PspA/IM30 family protein [Pseudomonadota bacterium]